MKRSPKVDDLANWVANRNATASRCSLCRNAEARDLIRASLDAAIADPRRHRHVSLRALHQYVAEKTGTSSVYTVLLNHVQRHEADRHEKWVATRYAR